MLWTRVPLFVTIPWPHPSICCSLFFDYEIEDQDHVCPQDTEFSYFKSLYNPSLDTQINKKKKNHKPFGNVFLHKYIRKNLKKRITMKMIKKCFKYTREPFPICITVWRWVLGWIVQVVSLSSVRDRGSWGDFSYIIVLIVSYGDNKDRKKLDQYKNGQP